MFFFSRVFLPRGLSYSACFGCGRVGEGGNWPSWRGQGGGAKGVRGSTNTPRKQNGLKRESAFIILSFFLFSPPSLAAKNTMPYTGTAPLSPPTRISSTDPDPVAVMAAREAAARAAHVRIEKAKVRRGAEGVRGRGRPRRLASGQPNARAGAIGPVEHAEVNGANTSRQRAPPVFFSLSFAGRRFPVAPSPSLFLSHALVGAGVRREWEAASVSHAPRSHSLTPPTPHTPHPTPHTPSSLTDPARARPDLLQGSRRQPPAGVPGGCRRLPGGRQGRSRDGPAERGGGAAKMNACMKKGGRGGRGGRGREGEE